MMFTMLLMAEHCCIMFYGPGEVLEHNVVIFNDVKFHQKWNEESILNVNKQQQFINLLKCCDPQVMMKLKH